LPRQRRYNPTPLSQLALNPGTRLGPYEITAPLGVGGMGEVYRAHDAKLNRDVALKVLPEAFAVDLDRLARFQREAQVLASLNHPGIAVIYGFEDSSTTLALVMELIDGPTLAERIAHGPVPVPESLSIARQLADALKAAHQLGIVHRDLKPANLKVRVDGRVKVLDFGLAKVLQPEAGPEAIVPTSMATVTAYGRTQVGTVLGTAAYMSPEQARGQHVDQRTDIWAFGCVLFEMLAGRSPFARKAASETLTAILEDEPDWDALPRLVPANIRGLLRRCLEKQPNRRLATLGEAEGDLLDHSAASQSRRRYPVMVTVFTGAAALAATVAFMTMRSPTAVTSPSEYVQLTNVTDAAVAPSLSPDGRLLAFKRGTDAFLGTGQIYVKVLPNGDAVRLTNDSLSKYGPVFTPDGSRVAYTQLTPEGASFSWDTWTVPVTGGTPTRLLPNASGLTWLPSQHLLFSEITTGIHMQVVSAAANRADYHIVYSPALDMGMAHYSYPSPDMKSVLVVEMGHTHTFDSPCRVVPLDGRFTGQLVGPQGMCSAAAWSPDGRWMYFSANVDGQTHLWRQRFPNGAPQQITSGTAQEEGVAVAPDGRALITSIGRRVSAIWLHDTEGERPITSEGSAADARWSADGTQVFYRDSGVTANANLVGPAPAGELRVTDIKRGSTDLVLPDTQVVSYDISHDGQRVVFTTTDHGAPQLWIAPINRSLGPRLLAASADQPSFGVSDTIIFRVAVGQTNYLERINTDGSGRARLLTTPIISKDGVSPDGEWVAAVVAVAHSGQSPSDRLALPYDTMAVSTRRGVPMRKLCNGACPVAWSMDGRFLYIGGAKTVVLPIPEGRSLPDLPNEGVTPGILPGNIPNAQLLPQGDVSAISDPSRYIFPYVELRANIFRIPLH
jgi:serine/threonine protein kinase/Tol biopolymer transport system component